jgi:hypothetical protein
MQSIKVRKIFVVSIVVALVLGTAVGAFAANNLQSITAYLNSGIKIVYNGNVQELKDNNDNKVVPITYNGTTYVPLRAISNILGEDVNWDSSSNSVILGTYEKQPVSLVSLSNTGGTKYSTIIKSTADLNIPGDFGTTQYTSGIYWNIWNGSMSTGEERQIIFDVPGYSSLTFSAWSDIACSVLVYDVDYKVVDTFALTENAITSRTIDITGINKISIGADGKPGSKGTLKILDPAVK